LAILYHGNVTQFKKWDATQLKSISPTEIMFENAFSSLDISRHYENFQKNWSDFFSNLDLVDVSYSFHCQRGLSEYGTCAFGFNVKDEYAAVIISDETKDNIVKLFRNGNVPRDEADALTGSSQICLEYFTMRFIWSFLSETGNASDNIQYAGEVPLVDLAEYPGETISVEMRMGGYRLVFEIILPPSLIDYVSRNSDIILPFKNFTPGNNNTDTVRFSSPLHTLVIDPSSLIDFLRSDAIILLAGSTFDYQTPVLLDQELECHASLYKSEGCFLFRFRPLEELDEIKEPGVSGTKVQVKMVDENVRVELLASSPIYYKSSTEVSSLVTLQIGGEVVARGELGHVDDTVAIRVIPKV
jgi:hypothetical protein